MYRLRRLAFIITTTTHAAVAQRLTGLTRARRHSYVSVHNSHSCSEVSAAAIKPTAAATAAITPAAYNARSSRLQSFAAVVSTRTGLVSVLSDLYIQ